MIEQEAPSSSDKVTHAVKVVETVIEQEAPSSSDKVTHAVKVVETVIEQEAPSYSDEVTRAVNDCKFSYYIFFILSPIFW